MAGQDLDRTLDSLLLTKLAAISLGGKSAPRYIIPHPVMVWLALGLDMGMGSYSVYL